MLLVSQMANREQEVHDQLADVAQGLKKLKGLKNQNDVVKEDILYFTKQRAELLEQLENLDKVKVSGAKFAQADQMSDDDVVPMLTNNKKTAKRQCQAADASAGTAKVRSGTGRLRGSHFCWFRC